MIALAKVRRPHGLDGAFTVDLLTSDPERIREVGTVRLGRTDEETRGDEFHVQSVRNHGRQVIVTLEGIADRAAAEAMRDMLLLIPEDAMAPLARGEYYQHQIIGCTVVDEAKTMLGVVAEVLEMPAQDVYVVVRGDHTWWLPAAKALIMDIDVSLQRITVRALDGLLDTGPAH
ncbi:16S rRNA processing protein RimM [Candidatus Fermentibacteria bacterium]|nr:16S rRNA processing protein RimM [Candidatus Fermentibacteria bacterium]